MKHLLLDYCYWALSSGQYLALVLQNIKGRMATLLLTERTRRNISLILKINPEPKFPLIKIFLLKHSNGFPNKPEGLLFL